MGKASTDYTHTDAERVIPIVYQHTVTIGTDTDAALSSAIDLGYTTPVALITSADWTNADITFQGSFDNSAFANMYEADGDEYTVTVTDTDAACWITLDPADFAGIKHLKVRSGTAADSVAQGSARTCYVLSRRVG